jgi:hypothetical protein
VGRGGGGGGKGVTGQREREMQKGKSLTHSVEKRFYGGGGGSTFKSEHLQRTHSIQEERTLLTENAVGQAIL